MIYNILKTLFSIAIRAYFRNISVKGLDHIPESGPVIFAPNHQSAFMDPIIAGSLTKRKLWFLARGESFVSPIAARIFSNLNMIPVYRPSETPELVHLNDQIFKKCFIHLANGDSILVFPEGNSKTEPRLRPLKTGLARIALGAEVEFPGVAIIPVGINYSNPHKFQSELYVSFGKPVYTSSYSDQWRQDNKGAVRDLTEHIKNALEENTIYILDEEHDELIRNIFVLYRHNLRNEFAFEKGKKHHDFVMVKEIISAVKHIASIDPESIKVFSERISRFVRTLTRLGIHDSTLETKTNNRPGLLKLLAFTIMLPLYWLCLINNIIPYKLTGILANKTVKRPDFFGSVLLAGGLFIYLICWSVQIILVHLFADNVWITLSYILFLPLSGLFAIYYYRHFRKIAGILRLTWLFYFKKDVIARILTERVSIISELDKAKEKIIVKIDHE